MSFLKWAFAGIVGMILYHVISDDPGSKMPAVEVKMPATQVKFIEAVTPFAQQYRGLPNELQKSTLRNQRAQAIQGVMPDMLVSKWVGRLKSLATTSEGKAYISIELPKSNIQIKTWNNALSDTFDNTLIENNSNIYNVLANLNQGATVEFSGRFLRSDKDYVKEGSLTEQGSMTSPEFLFKFSAISAK